MVFRFRFIGIIALLALIGLMLGHWRASFPWPWPQPEKLRPSESVAERVAAGVSMAGHDLSGFDRQALTAWLERQAHRWRREPVPARLDPVTKGVIPGLDGYELDLEATVAAVLTAPEGAAVEPVWRWFAPEVTLDDFPLAPLYQGNPQQPAVTFLVNVAWGNEELLQMLEILAAENVKATFFLVGRWVDANPDLARAILDHGHEVASHGYSDAISIGSVSAAVAREDLRRAHEAIVQVGAEPPRFFSPHRGELSQTLLEVCHELGYRLVMWTVDTIDWQDPAPGVLLNRVLGKVRPGSLILMHPRRVTVRALPALIAELRARNLPPITLSELIDPRRQSPFSP